MSGGVIDAELVVSGAPQRDERPNVIGKHRAARQQCVDLVGRQEEDVVPAFEPVRVDQTIANRQRDAAQTGVEEGLLQPRAFAQQNRLLRPAQAQARRRSHRLPSIRCKRRVSAMRSCACRARIAAGDRRVGRDVRLDQLDDAFGLLLETRDRQHQLPGAAEAPARRETRRTARAELRGSRRGCEATSRIVGSGAIAEQRRQVRVGANHAATAPTARSAACR